MEQLAQPWGEIALYHDFANRIWQGQLPYKDFFPEYPPLSLFFFWIADVFGTQWFTIIYYMLITIFVFLLIILIQKKQGNPYIFLASVLPLGGLFWDRFDIFPAFFAFLSLYLVRKNIVLSSLSLGIGIMIKIFPLAFLPIIFFQAWKQGKLLVSIFTLSMIIALTIIPILVYGGSFGKFIEFQGKRGIQIESFRATPLLIQALLGKKEVIVEYKHYTYEVREK